MQWPLFKKPASPDSEPVAIHEVTPMVQESGASDSNPVVTASLSPRFFHEEDPVHEVATISFSAEPDLEPVVMDLEEPAFTSWASPEEKSEIPVDSEAQELIELEEWEAPAEPVAEVDDLVMWLGEVPALDSNETLSLDEAGAYSLEDLGVSESWMDVPPMDPEASIASISDFPEASSQLLEASVEDLSWDTLETLPDSSFDMEVPVETVALSFNTLEPSDPILEFSPDSEIPEVSSQEIILPEAPPPEIKREIKIAPPTQASYADLLETLQRDTLIEEVHFIQNSINRLVNGYFEDQALELEKR